MSLVVKFAVYGAISQGDNPNSVVARDVTRRLQSLIDENGGLVKCDNESFGDPVHVGKHFGAVVTRDGADFFFACNEGQTINFNHGGGHRES